MARNIASPKYPSPAEELTSFLGLIIRAPLLSTLALHFIVGPIYYAYFSTLPYNSSIVFAVSLTVAHIVVFTVAHSFFCALDKFKLLQRHKLPRNETQTNSAELIRNTLLEEIINMLLVSPVLAGLYHYYVLTRPDKSAPLQKFGANFLHFIGATMWNEILFYAAHRTLHEWPVLYQAIHKKHHMYKGTISIAAEWASPIESLFASTIPTVGYMFLVQAETPLIATWLLVRLWETYESHSGYCFKNTLLAKIGLLNSYGAEFHDFHHRNNIGNYGAPYLDYLFGTQDSFLQYQQSLKQK